jgi:hypothetical protein
MRDLSGSRRGSHFHGFRLPVPSRRGTIFLMMNFQLVLIITAAIRSAE